MNYHCENCGWLNCHFNIRQRRTTTRIIMEEAFGFVGLFAVALAYPLAFAGYIH